MQRRTLHAVPIRLPDPLCAPPPVPPPPPLDFHIDMPPFLRQAPLENHHVAEAYRTLHRPGNNFVAHLRREDRILLRRYMIELVLATDMKQHLPTLSRFKTVHKEVVASASGEGFASAAGAATPDQSPHNLSDGRLERHSNCRIVLSGSHATVAGSAAAAGMEGGQPPKERASLTGGFAIRCVLVVRGCAEMWCMQGKCGSRLIVLPGHAQCHGRWASVCNWPSSR